MYIIQELATDYFTNAKLIESGWTVNTSEADNGYDYNSLS